MMKLNEKKTTNMILNFSKDHQFTTEIELKNEKIETLNQTKFLGVIITNNLKWHENTKNIVKNANRKMALLHRFPKFTKNKSHLMHLFKTQVGGCLEYCSTVWKFMKLDSLKQRREKMALKFAKKSLKQDCYSRLFPVNTSKHMMENMLSTFQTVKDTGSLQCLISRGY